MSYCEIDDLSADAVELRTLRRQLHRRPELAFAEFGTSALVADRLREWGYDVVTGVGETGVVGSLHVGPPGGRSIGIRADMDALPIQEETGLEHASEVPGCMHACGHDGHTTMLLGAARHLARTRNFHGTLRLYFQPAEERCFDSGAQRMIEDGLFERFPCDAIFGLHNHPGEAPGRFLFREGPFMAAADKIVIRIEGKGGHAARPHLAVDATVVASSIVMALQTIVSRNANPSEAVVVTVGSLHSGVANNVISGLAEMELSIRSFNEEVQSRTRELIVRIAENQAASYGATAHVECLPGYPVLVNSADETAFAIEVARELVGDEAVVPDFGPVTGSEDFAFYLHHRPGCFLRLGNGILGGNNYFLHHPRYDFNDHNLTVGAAYWTRLVERYLSNGATGSSAPASPVSSSKKDVQHA